MTASNDLLAQLADSAPRHLEELIQWLRIPSVSSDSSRVSEVKQAATWVADKLECAGLSVEILPTEGHPMVYAESPRIDGAPVVLVYGHYDVQPVEPLDEWVNGPMFPFGPGSAPLQFLFGSCSVSILFRFRFCPYHLSTLI